MPLAAIFAFLFWVSLGLLVYVYVGYPLLLTLLARFSELPPPDPALPAPAVTLLISAFNESQVIAAKLQNALALEYPRNLLDIIVISDGSDDGTDEIVQQFSAKGVRLLRQEPRLGKTAGLNLGISQARGQILLFSDANAMYQPAAVRRLVRHFSNPKVGYVVGNARYYEKGTESSSAQSEGLYWKLETYLKKKESRFDSVVGGDGAIYAIRRELYSPLLPTDINDFLNPLQIIARGYSGVFEPDAVCYEEAAENFSQEYRRKVRIISRSLNAIRRVPQVLNPLRRTRHWFLLLSHKVLRWFAPFLMIVCFAANLALWRSPFYKLTAILQAAFYALALVGWKWRPSNKLGKIFSLAYYFCLVNLASLVGCVKCFRGDLSGKWTPPRQKVGSLALAANGVAGSLGAFTAVENWPRISGGGAAVPSMTVEAPRANALAQTTRPLRVLHVLDHSWPVHTGYSIRSLHLIASQCRLGLRPEVLTGPLQIVDDPGAADTMVENIAYRRTPFGGKFSEWAISRRRPLLREAAIVRLIRNRILELAKKERVDLIHAHSPALCGLGALQAARSQNIPFVYELRAFWEDAAVDQNKTSALSLRYRLSQKLENYVVHRANAVVGISQSILDELKKRKTDSAKLFHVPNGVDTKKFSPILRDERLAAELGLGGEPVLGFIGSLYRWEGVEWLVRAVAELRRRGTACQLLIVGDGDEMPAVREAVRELHAEEFIQILGRVPHDEIARYYSVVDALVYPRHSIRLTELVTPLKPLEAMALGKAILGSDVGGIRELVEAEKTGVLFRADNVEDFCAQAKRLLEQPSLQRRLGEQARRFILREKDWNVLARRYIDIYDFALRNR